MPALDIIKQMQQSGYSEEEITQKLMEQGYSPKDVNDSMNQSKIKAAVSEENVQNSDARRRIAIAYENREFRQSEALEISKQTERFYQWALHNLPNL